MVPDVVQMSNAMIDGRAVSGSLVQFDVGLDPENPEGGVEQAVRLGQEREQDHDRRRAGDRREEEGRPKERLTVDLLVDDQRQRQAEGHLRRDDHGRLQEQACWGSPS